MRRGLVSGVDVLAGRFEVTEPLVAVRTLDNWHDGGSGFTGTDTALAGAESTASVAECRLEPAWPVLPVRYGVAHRGSSYPPTPI